MFSGSREFHHPREGPNVGCVQENLLMNQRAANGSALLSNFATPLGVSVGEERKRFVSHTHTHRRRHEFLPNWAQFKDGGGDYDKLLV